MQFLRVKCSLELLFCLPYRGGTHVYNRIISLEMNACAKMNRK